MKNPAFLLNLPSEIAIDILSRIPIRTVAQCKCVCKRLLKILSTPEFAKSHLSRSTPGLIVYLTQMGQTVCRIVEYEDVLGLQSHDLHYKPLMKFDPTEFISSPSSRVSLQSSVNGLLCLHDLSAQLDALYVCNPITREYIPISGLSANAGYPNIVTYGFGVSASSGQYKVVRIFHEPVNYNGTGSRLSNLKVECSVYTLGTGSWRSIDPGNQYEYDIRPSVGAFLNGNLHWLVGDAKGSLLISCLDLETEVFNPFPPPPFPDYFPPGASLVVLGDCLWLCDYASDDEIVIWVMKEYGVKESWTNMFVVNKYPDLGGISYESVTPLKAFKDGDILFLWQDTCLFYYCNKTETAPEVGLFERDECGWIEALPHTSSFISLKIIAMENVISF